MSQFRLLNVAILFCGSFISACSTISSTKTNYYQISDHVTELLEARRFDEAKNLVKGKGDICKGYNANGFCYAGELKGAESQLAARVDLAEKCNSAIDEAEAVKTMIREEAEKAIERVRTACDSDKYKTIARGLTVPGGYIARIHNVEERLKEAKNSARHSEQLENGQPNTLAIAKNSCVGGLKWGYVLKGKMNPKKDPVESLHGQFKTKDECEEARLAAQILVDRQSLVLLRSKFLFQRTQHDWQANL
jgi:hypothetical protein